jgi:hypothetical protein
MTQYKIVEEKDGNGDVHYEIWIERKFLWWTFWEPVKHTHPEDHSLNVIRKFSTIDSAKKFINVHYRERKIIETGELQF